MKRIDFEMNARRWAVVGAVMVLLLAVVAVLWATTRSGGGPTDDMADMQMNGMEMGGMAMDDGTVRIDAEMARSLGVTFATAELEPMQRSIRTTGNVVYDETRLSTVSLKFDGWAERLYVDFTGQSVRRGEPLMEVYSPELVSAQEELLAAVRLEGRLSGSAAPGVADRSGGLVESARRRLALWDISPRQIREIEESGEVRRTLTLHAPFAGFVVEKNVQAGERVGEGEALYRLADLSTVWVNADVYESDLRFVREGAPVQVEVDAYPGERIAGEVSYIHPDLDRETRTATVRVVAPNPDGRLKPGMFATVHLEAPVAERAVTVPRDAVMRTGTRDLVFVDDGPGRYEIREVRVGADADGKTEVVSGLLAGERVVARANFILDAESRLMETMMGQPDMPGGH